MQTAINLEFRLNPEFNEDDRTGLFTASFKEFPRVIAVGESIEDAKVKLNEGLQVLFNVRKEEVVNEIIRQNIDKLSNLNKYLPVTA